MQLQGCWGVSYLPGLLGLLTSGGGGLVRGGGLGGAASGASDMVDDSDPAMRCGTAVSDLTVKKLFPWGVYMWTCTGVFTVCSIQEWSMLIRQLDVFHDEANSHCTTWDRKKMVLALFVLPANIQKICWTQQNKRQFPWHSPKAWMGPWWQAAVAHTSSSPSMLTKLKTKLKSNQVFCHVSKFWYCTNGKMLGWYWYLDYKFRW